MARTINVSTAVFATIWAKRQSGEESESTILARLLGCDDTDAIVVVPNPAPQMGGVHDTRNGVHFPRGFIAFRNYKGRPYEAVAGDGSWQRKDTGAQFPTLNQLNASITTGVENVWNGNWKYRDGQNRDRPISDLRP